MSNELRPVTTIEILDAIDELIDLRMEEKMSGRTYKTMELIKIARRTIADGLRYHSGAKGIVVGEQ